MRNLTIAVSAWLLCAVSAQAAHLGQLKFLTWEDYLSPEVIELWHQRSGLGLDMILIDSDEARDQILLDAERLQLDLVMLGAQSARRFQQQDWLAPQPPLSNLVHLEPQWQQRCGTSALPYMWGTLGIVYRKDQFPTPPQSWQTLLQPDPRYAGRISMLDDSRDTLSAALLTLGYSINSEAESELRHAFELLRLQAPMLIGYDYPISLIQQPERGSKLVMGLAYSSDHLTLNSLSEQEDAWGFSLPQEGTLIWTDCLAVLNSSRQQQQAWQFQNFLMEPDVARINAEYLGTATPNATARQLLPLNIQQDPGIYPPAEYLQKSQSYPSMSPAALNTRSRILSTLKNLHEAQ
ncbi:polyamine ABC transporter substrate-binding protein [Balneatrix alpica]|uniref:polyamine ABC transporter substrate-binding protein n=1 Tax=Balneatrix alpica TaxID=75684 RepID=UPI002739FAD9|nr:spermidine/putrescine ABC transporter substrate-binding protein [Balneatrix alpica]